MNLSRKAALGVAVCAAGALLSGTTGTASAYYGDLYGAYAVTVLGNQWHIAYTYNAPDQATADSHAMDLCGYSDCVIPVRWVNGCAALVDRDGDLYTGLGRTLVEASRNALAASGPDPNPLMVSLGSAEPSQAKVLDSRCTANAG
ncbi:DUF4189 domain-containing protein [Nocardia sp. CDC160]|uniref:DUF4189 domain-containing protein n=1 Tax=Nocardia sp. CDC160 TaxID=3112166 RepID=UPI002DBACB26|nr:DUF4189 domain-containing protein [Nocardia sp. CDC160]MEC3915583.1 DUF4189 domain-containing protein [Nocardia sp. CDC160]